MFVNGQSQQNFSYQRMSIYLKGVAANVCRTNVEGKIGMLSVKKSLIFNVKEKIESYIRLKSRCYTISISGFFFTYI